MNDRLLAPQFGLQRKFAEELQALDIPAPPNHGGPVIIVKRRRLLEKPGSVDATVAESPAPGSLDVPVKQPKVFHLEPRHTEKPELPAEATAEAVEPLVPAMPLRRPRDPAKAPTLLQHVVFEVEPVLAPEPYLQRGREYQEVMRQLAQLREKVNGYQAGQSVRERLEDAWQKARDAKYRRDEKSLQGGPSAE